MLAETHRILSLPSRALPTLPAWAVGLREVQVRALAECQRAGGLLGIIGCGQGKALISFLCPTVLGAQRPVLLVPAGVVAQTLREVARWRQSYPIPGNLEVVSYSALSTERGWAAFERLDADCIVADEAHHLRHPTAARTRRLLGWYQAHPSCRFVALSGTMASRSLREVGHLAELALRERSPLPQDWHVLEAWCAHVDHTGANNEPPTPAQRAIWAPVRKKYGGASDREAARRLLQSSDGVVCTADSSAAECSLRIQHVRLQAPDELREAARQLDTQWRLPDGEDLLRATDVAWQRRCLHSGYYLRHDWQHPGWQQHREARAQWAACLDEVLASGRAGIDSRGQAEAWVRSSGQPRYARALYAWEAVAQSLDAHGQPVWLSTAWVRKVADYARFLEEQRDSAVLIWTETPAMRAELGRQGMHVVGLDDTPPPQRTCVVSRRSHGTGLNLQGYNTCLLAEQPTSADAWEQLLARVHRVGQLADDVLFVVPYWQHSVLRHFDQARAQAAFIQETTSQTQKLLLASHEWDLTKQKEDD
jgi:hypothetical protein